MENNMLYINVDVTDKNNVPTSVSENEEVIVKVLEGAKNTGGVTDYKQLTGLPKLNGKTIIGNVEESDPTVPEWAKQPEKPEYTAEEVGAVPIGGAITVERLNEMFKSVFGE